MHRTTELDAHKPLAYLLTALLLMLIPILSGQIVRGQIHQTISYQGVLTDASGTVVPDGNYNIAFKLYDVPTGGTQLWEETQLVAVSKGYSTSSWAVLTP